MLHEIVKQTMCIFSLMSYRWIKSIFLLCKCISLQTLRDFLSGSVFYGGVSMPIISCKLHVSLFPNAAHTPSISTITKWVWNFQQTFAPLFHTTWYLKYSYCWWCFSRCFRPHKPQQHSHSDANKWNMIADKRASIKQITWRKKVWNGTKLIIQTA